MPLASILLRNWMPEFPWLLASRNLAFSSKSATSPPCQTRNWLAVQGLASVDSAVNPLGGINGTLFVNPAGLIVVHLGQLVNSSSETFPLSLGQLAPGAEALTLSLQMAFVGFGSSPSVSGMARLVVLDSAF